MFSDSISVFLILFPSLGSGALTYSQQSHLPAFLSKQFVTTRVMVLLTCYTAKYTLERSLGTLLFLHHKGGHSDLGKGLCVRERPSVWAAARQDSPPDTLSPTTDASLRK